MARFYWPGWPHALGSDSRGGLRALPVFSWLSGQPSGSQSATLTLTGDTNRTQIRQLYCPLYRANFAPLQQKCAIIAFSMLTSMCDKRTVGSSKQGNTEMANFKYFNGTEQLAPASVFFDSKTRKFYGTPEGFKPYWVEADKRWERGTVVAERSIEYKSNPSRHECDARCLNATGRTMKCECSCGGKNHGRGSFICAEAA